MVTVLKHFKRHFAIYLIVIFYLLFSFLTYKDIPIANGEEYRYLRGMETLDHLLHGEFKEKLLQPIPNYFLYNLYPMMLVFLNPKFYYEWFHLFNMVFASLGFVGVYVLSLDLLKNRFFSVFSVASLFLFPTFFGQLGNNPIDMPFMVFYLWSLIVILRYLKYDSNHWSTLLIGLLLGVTQGLRQVGFTIYVLMLISDLYDYFSFQNRESLAGFIKERFLKYIYIFIVATFFMLITWPNFAINFFKSFWWYLFVGSDFYLWNFGLLYFGQFLENFQRPWYYLPLFQLITFPIYISTFFLGVFYFFKKQVKNKTYFIITSALLINFILYLVLRPVLYDGIRHFLYMVPLIVLIAVSNMELIFKSVGGSILKYVIGILIILNLVYLAFYSVKEFPYQYVYFNPIANLLGNPYKLLESDYSNTKYREAAEWLRNDYLATEEVYSHSNLDEMLRVYACDNAYSLDYYSHKKFLTVIDKDGADLTVCDYKNLKQSGYEGELVKTFYLDSHDLLYVIK